MRVPYFLDPAREATLRAAARAWLGTPFREGGRVPGRHGGVDCVGFILACYVAAGFVAAGEVVVPAYDVDHYEHSDVSRLEEWFRAPAVRERMPRCDEAEPRRTGDLVFIRHRRAVHHCALWIDGALWHTVRGHGVLAMKPETLELTGAQLRSHYRPHAPAMLPSAA